ncbi:hypothetical protein QQF64_000937 [Cirrhinus molitorella]|uniref:Uncharacterized protein n=1 Tax=Cirrhinus molitorella TaxID=172907 RepID=A0ABR3NYM5_9TELE
MVGWESSCWAGIHGPKRWKSLRRRSLTHLGRLKRQCRAPGSVMPHPCRVPNRRTEPFISVSLSVFFSSAAASPTFLRSPLPLVYRSVRMDEREDFTSF